MPTKRAFRRRWAELIVRPRRLMGEGPAGETRREIRGRSGRTIPRRRAYERPAGAPAARSSPTPPVGIVADPEIDDRAREAARELVRRVVARAPRPVQHIRVTLRRLRDPALERPAIAKATLDVSGRNVRAHVAAKTIQQALGALEERLCENLENVEEKRRVGRHRMRTASPGEWRHGDLPTRRPDYFDRPADERELVRRKTYELAARTPEQAAAEMDALDYDFHPFTSADTGEDSVVYRRPIDGVGLARVRPSAANAAGSPLTADRSQAPVLLLEAAIERLNITNERFLFFVDAQSGRGTVLYRRYDGHYGLIEAATEAGERRST